MDLETLRAMIDRLLAEGRIVVGDGGALVLPTAALVERLSVSKALSWDGWCRIRRHRQSEAQADRIRLRRRAALLPSP